MQGDVSTISAVPSTMEDNMDFLGNGSLMDLATKMDDTIDVVLDEILHMDDNNKNPTSSSNRDVIYSKDRREEQQIDPKKRSSENDDAGESHGLIHHASLYDSMSSQFSNDDEIIHDSGTNDSALAKMQAELLEADLYNAEQQHGRGQGGGTVSLTPETDSKKRMVTVVVKKPSQDSPIGISMKTSKGCTTIVGILETGLLSNSELKPGMELLRVNGVPIQNAKHARHLIQCSSSKVKLVAMDGVLTKTQSRGE
ncbi:hypothetical protein IV203_036855 [Nitzschia inconspicua]|uniref:PDZ domain-containing protein n=1 Tax=Nitzschia inconspicua TaxID=303405 RepID=A0A9K3PYE7_9STRA|nr:hypothetical protein IV203_036855 [Nitzschia inconspicua]